MSKGRQILLFLYSTPNLVGALLGCIGLILHFAGIIDSFWLPIVIGLYGIGYLAAPKNPKQELNLRNQWKVVDIRNEMEMLTRRVRRRIPKESFEKVKSIQASIVEVLPQIEDLSSSDYNTYLIQQTALDYLPAALESYINLPKAYADYQPIKGNKTSRQVLYEQLDLLDKTMHSIKQEIYSNDTQKLLIHGQFLKDKFGEEARAENNRGLSKE